jgi:hypothetical protein
MARFTIWPTGAPEIPVKLVPGKTYVLWFNRGQFNSFRDADNHPAVPYQLVFQAKAN